MKFLRFKTILYISLFSLFFALPAFAVFAQQAPQDAINQQDWITRNQQNILEEKKRDNEFETIKKERERKQKEEEEENKKLQDTNVSSSTADCFPITSIKLNGADSLSWFRKRSLIKPFIGKCMEGKILSEIIKSLNEYYQHSGYITTQIVVPQQNLKSGIFELQIIEGKIEKISLNKDSLTDKMQEFTAFGNAEENILNIEDINQGMYQINRLRSNQAVMKIEPGSEKGDSKIIIDNNKKFPARFTIGKDNLGNKFSGVQRTSFSSNFDNLLSLNDNLNLNYTTNLNNNSQLKDLKSFSSTLSLPFKYNTLSYDYYHSEFKGQNPGVNGSTTLTGFSQQSKITLDRVLLNQTNLRLSLSASLANKGSASYLEGEKIETSQRQLSIMNIGFAISSYFNNTTSLYLKPSYSRGLKILNAKQDIDNASASTPKAQFEAFKLYGNFSKRFTIPKINAPIIFTTEMDSQFAKETLFGSEQFSVGGYYSVRGFRENYITGDSGYYFRNKLNFNAGSLILPFLNSQNNSQSFFARNLIHLNKVKFEPFYDYGAIRNKYNGSSGRLSGAGLKTIFESSYFNASLTYSWGINKSNLINSNTKENQLIYFEISTSCC